VFRWRVACWNTPCLTPSPTPQRHLAEVAKYGTAHVKRAYGDWTGTSLRGWKDQLLAQSIQPIQQFAYTTGKNATDAALVIDAMDLLYSGRLDGFCLVSSDSDFTRLAARIRESGLTVYGFGEHKTPKPFVAACDKFIYLENLTYGHSATALSGVAVKPASRTPAAKLTKDTALVNQLRNAVEASSDDDGWAHLAHVGHILTQQRPDFDARNYGYTKLSDLVAATALFDLGRRTPGDGKPGVIHVRGKHHQNKRPIPAPVNPTGDSPTEDAFDEGGVPGGSEAAIAGTSVEADISE